MAVISRRGGNPKGNGRRSRQRRVKKCRGKGGFPRPSGSVASSFRIAMVARNVKQKGSGKSQSRSFSGNPAVAASSPFWAGGRIQLHAGADFVRDANQVRLRRRRDGGCRAIREVSRPQAAFNAPGRLFRLRLRRPLSPSPGRAPGRWLPEARSRTAELTLTESHAASPRRSRLLRSARFAAPRLPHCRCNWPIPMVPPLPAPEPPEWRSWGRNG